MTDNINIYIQYIYKKKHQKGLQYYFKYSIASIEYSQTKNPNN